MKTFSVISMIAGVIALIISVLFKLTHWPGANFALIFGLIFFVFGLVFLIRLQNKK